MTTDDKSVTNRDIPTEEVQSLLDKNLGPEAAIINDLLHKYTRRFVIYAAAGIVMGLAALALIVVAVVAGVSHGFTLAVPFIFFALAAVALIVAVVMSVRRLGGKVVYLYERLEQINAEHEQGSPGETV